MHRPMSPGWPTPTAGSQLHFLDHDPTVGWDEGYSRYGADLEASGLAKHLWTAPFIQTVFGTDAYTDQLRDPAPSSEPGV